MTENSEQSNVCLIIVYEGKWPAWMSFFLKTCEQNKFIRFLFFSSHPVHTQAPNIQRVNFSLADFNALASSKLAMEVGIQKPYKICDFRPAFGVIFEDYLKGFDFWGYMDIDVILGDLRYFFNDEILQEYDVIPTKKEHLTGHLTLIRNNDLCNRLFQRSEDLEEIFGSDESFSFDECGPIYRPLNEGIPIQEIERKVDSFTHVVSRSRDIKASFITRCQSSNHLDHIDNWKLMMKDGKLWNVNQQKEISHLHFHAYKKFSRFYIPKSFSDMDYLISIRGIESIDRPEGVELLAMTFNRLKYFVAFYAERPILMRRQLKRWIFSGLFSKS